MDEDFGRRCGEVRVTFGPLGPHTQITDWARFLGVPVRKLYNLENGCRPRSYVLDGLNNKGLDALAAMFEAIRKAGVDPRRVAAWAWSGTGTLPRPTGGAIVPNVSAPSRPGVAEERGELSHRTPRKGILAADVLSAEKHTLDEGERRAARDMIDAVLTSKSPVKMERALRQLRELLSCVIGPALLLATTAAPARTASAQSYEASCRTWDRCKKKARAGKKTKAPRAPKVSRTSGKKNLKPVLTVPSSTTLTGMSQKHPFFGATG